MKTLFTSTLFIVFSCFITFAQQPTVWPITGDRAVVGTGPTDSWATAGFDASSSIVGGIWKLYQPSKTKDHRGNSTAETADRNCHIQYNPGFVTGQSEVSASYSNILTNSPEFRYLIIRLKNYTLQDKLLFRYRILATGSTTAAVWKTVDMLIDPKPAVGEPAFKDYIIDVSTLANWGDLEKMSLIRWDFANNVSTYEDGQTPSLLLEVDHIGFSATTTLPVSLASFTVQKLNSGIQLNWITASEKDNSHFDVLRSGDGVHFEKISSVAGNGNSSEVRNYSFIDANPFPGTNYYQLNQIDLDGKSSKSEIKAVNSGIKNIDFTVFADKGGVKVQAFSNNNGKAILILTDISGKKTFKEDYNLYQGLNSLNISSVNLKPGIHVATLSRANEKVSVKFIVQ